MRPIDTWARRLENWPRCPRFFGAPCRKSIRGDFPYTVYAPADRWGFGRVTPSSSASADGRLSLAGTGQGRGDWAVLPFADVTRVEWEGFCSTRGSRSAGSSRDSPPPLRSSSTAWSRIFSARSRRWSAPRRRGYLPPASEALRSGAGEVRFARRDQLQVCELGQNKPPARGKGTGRRLRAGHRAEATPWPIPRRSHPPHDPD